MKSNSKTKDLKMKNPALFRRIPLTPKMAIVVLIVGILIWSIADGIQSRVLKEILEDQFIERIGNRAIENRMRFDQYIKAHYQSVKLFITQKRFNDYLDKLEDRSWDEERDLQIKYYTQLPPWFPDFSVMRTFVQARFVLLLDEKRRVREVYQSRKDKLPEFLLEPETLLYQLSQNQSFLTLYENTPYIIASESILDQEGQLRAILTLASPIDAEFLVASQGTTASMGLLALVTTLRPRILTSNNPNLLPAGIEVDTLNDRFLIMQEGFIDYGDSDLIVKLATFVPKTKIESLVGIILDKEQMILLVVFNVLVLSFLLVMIYITQQIRNLTQYVVTFEKQELGFEKSETIKGDELYALRDRFHDLADEVLLSREIIKKESAEQTRMIIDNALDAVIAIDAKNQLITTWNPRADAIFGWSREEMLGQRIGDTIIPPQYRQTYLEGLKHFLVTGEGPILNKPIELTAMHRDGHEFPIELSASVARSGQTTIISAFVRDITKRKELEEQLIQASKMESVGRLAGGVAHDFNNILSAIIGYSEIALNEIKNNNPLKKYIEVIYNSANRAANLTQQLLAFSRKQVIKPQILNLNILIEDIHSMLSKVIGEDIETNIVKGEGLWNIKADHAQMEQIVVNLAVNARDAISKCGTLAIETANTTVSKENMKEHANVELGEYVMLSVSDNGSGIPEEVKEHIFEPFFTTKKLGKSTGLGLATVYGIVKQNQGNINVFSEHGKGTTFNIYLQRSKEEEVTKQVVDEKSTKILHGSETVLVVEDDSAVRNVTVTELSRIGYKVLEAKNGLDAIEVSNRFKEDINLVLTDMIMPKMGGLELAQQIIRIRPDIKILYISGYMESNVARQDILKRGINYLQKPVKFNVLAQTVRRVLDEASLN